MSWVKLDDGFPDHPKVHALSDKAFRAHVTAICYSARFLTDGYIPSEWAKRLATPKQRAELHAAGLWHPRDAGWTIHNFLTYNRSREQVETDRSAARSRQAKSRRTSGEGSGELRRESHSPDPTRPEPVPDLVHEKNHDGGLNRGLLDSLFFRHPDWEEWLNLGLLGSLVSESGRQAVNAAIDDLYATKQPVRDPAGYLRSRARAYAKRGDQ